MSIITILLYIRIVTSHRITYWLYSWARFILGEFIFWCARDQQQQQP